MWQDEPYTPKEDEAKELNVNYLKVKNFRLANNYCKNLDLLNYHNWRLPSIEEYARLYSVKNYLHNKTDALFWTASYDENNYLLGYIFNLKDNHYIQEEKYTTNYIRCVRDIQN